MKIPLSEQEIARIEKAKALGWKQNYDAKPDEAYISALSFLSLQGIKEQAATARKKKSFFMAE